MFTAPNSSPGRTLSGSRDSREWQETISVNSIFYNLDFAKGLPGDNEVISGMRYSCNVIIEIDMAKAIKDGYKFYKSLNDVILCPGKGDEGALPPTYFSKVHFMDLNTKKLTTVPLKPKKRTIIVVL